VDFGAAGLVANLAGPLFLIIVLFVVARRRARRPRAVEDGPADEPYRVYTREFDLAVDASAVAAILPTASPDASRGWAARRVGDWRQALARRDAWREARRGDLEARSERLAASFGTFASNVAVSLLVDQSGSMRGPRIAAVAATAEWLSELLTRHGARTEILGFSTAGWHGGHVYAEWKNCGRPRRPGRLCALMHVVYKSADEPALEAEAADTLLNPDLLRENVDGEAILWAAGRLSERPERRKLLIVISDGAPVDDATLLHNGPRYLERHLQSVLDQLRIAGEVEVGAVGVGHAVGRYYAVSTEARALDALPDACVELIERMIGLAEGPKPRTQGTGPLT
jgi:cobaltochelatase CobT